MELEERLCDDMETVRNFTYLGDRVSANGGCQAAVTARTRCGWVKFREYGEYAVLSCIELLYGWRFPLMLIGAVYRSYVRAAMLYGSEAWYLKESDMGILQRAERTIVRAMCGVLLKDIYRSTGLMFMLSLNEGIDELAMVGSVNWYGHVLRREADHVLRSALDC